MKPLNEIESIEDYISTFSAELGHRAAEILRPLHVPGKSATRDIGLAHKLFEAQVHAVEALVRMMQVRGSGFLCGECGVGKTLMGLAAVHSHAACKPYRAIVLCPDHLIAKWCRELASWIPDAKITRFGPSGEQKTTKKNEGTATRQTLRDMSALVGRMDGGWDTKTLPSGVRQERHRRPAPAGAEWYVLGKNQAKYMSEWVGLGDNAEDHVHCPKCGQIAQDGDGSVIDPKKLTRKSKQRCCNAIILKAVFDPAFPSVPGGQWMPKPADCPACKAGETVRFQGRTWIASECNEPLYAYTSKPYRWSPAAIIQRKLRGTFKYLVLDEGHEHKSQDAQQAVASSKLIGSVQHVLALTGTLIGGYAHHLFPLMMRITPESLRADGFTWGSTTDFSRQCGRVDLHVTTTIQPKKPREKEPRKSVINKTAIAPGIMPSIYAKHLMGTSVFLSLDELHDELPDLFEYAGGPVGADASRGMRDGWFETAIEMDPDQRLEVQRVTRMCKDANAELLRNNSRRFLGASMWTCLDYPDRPFGWAHDDELIESWRADGKEGVPSHLEVVGYYDNGPEEERSHENWVGVVTPKDLPSDRVYPKEKALIDICKQQYAEGRQTWVYVTMTGKRDIQPRLQKLLQAEGLRVGILRANTVAPIDREQWIEENGMSYDVIISNAELVKTGLDLFSPRDGGHNFSTLVFYETGFNPFTLRQAAARSWRVGQTLDCRVFYLYYLGTAQESAMLLMARKTSASQSLEGNFDGDGLASMAVEDNLQLALCRALADEVGGESIQRSWQKRKAC